MSGNPIQSWILDSTLSIADSGYWIPDSLSAELVFWIPVVSGILDFLSWITDLKTEDSGLRIPQANISCDFGFHKQRSPGLRNPDYLTWGDIKIWLVFSFAFSFCPREIDDPSEKVAYLVEDSRKSSVPVRSDHTDSKGPTSVWEWNWNARTNGPETLVHITIV